jgi:hypothetical protein
MTSDHKDISSNSQADYFKPCDFSTDNCSGLNSNFSSEFTISYVVNKMSPVSAT